MDSTGTVVASESELQKIWNWIKGKVTIVENDLAEILGALIGAGLRVEHLHELPTSPAPFWDWMVQDEARWWWLPDGKGGLRRDLPLSFSIRATRPAT